MIDRANVVRAHWADRLLTPSQCADRGGDDSSIVAGLAIGDEAAFRLLVERESEHLFRICYRLLGSRTEAEQATAAAFVMALSKLETYDPALRPAAWLSAIATRVARHYWVTRLEREPPSDLEVPWKSPAAEERVEEAGWPMDASERSATRFAISSLPDLEREAVSLLFFGELSIDEVAAVTGRTEPEVSVTLERAVDLLAEAASTIDHRMAVGT